MPLITFMSDYGHTDHYVAAVKATIYRNEPTAVVVDISHAVQQFHLPHAAYILNSVFREFPKGTIHMIGLSNTVKVKDRFVALKLEGHYFLGADNGLFSLISTEKPEEIVVLEASNEDYIFPAQKIFVPAALKLLAGSNLQEIGLPETSIKELLNRQLRRTNNQLIGHVVHVDTYGNLVTNISKNEFEECTKGKSFNVHFGREKLHEISVGYYQADNADCLALFNTNGLLEIAMVNGNASQLLGMHYDSPVMVSF